ncbi:Hypothetical predicted protein [Mytilus galloprovincialis]|uniref:Uncharacterized protein n=1 Tax=Mytilus galloprovincialis TaxID=29158 RepID=A0A8B6E2A9_MYTGA|nr:Hypothetical predicted protein [Mytilus galloprovincialis]
MSTNRINRTGGVYKPDSLKSEVDGGKFERNFVSGEIGSIPAIPVAHNKTLSQNLVTVLTDRFIIKDAKKLILIAEIRATRTDCNYLLGYHESILATQMIRIILTLPLKAS